MDKITKAKLKRALELEDMFEKSYEFTESGMRYRVDDIICQYIDTNDIDKKEIIKLYRICSTDWGYMKAKTKIENIWLSSGTDEYDEFLFGWDTYYTDNKYAKTEYSSHLISRVEKGYSKVANLEKIIFSWLEDKRVFDLNDNFFNEIDDINKKISHNLYINTGDKMPDSVFLKIEEIKNTRDRYEESRIKEYQNLLRERLEKVPGITDISFTDISSVQVTFGLDYGETRKKTFYPNKFLRRHILSQEPMTIDYVLVDIHGLQDFIEEILREGDFIIGDIVRSYNDEIDKKSIIKPRKNNDDKFYIAYIVIFIIVIMAISKYLAS